MTTKQFNIEAKALLEECKQLRVQVAIEVLWAIEALDSQGGYRGEVVDCSDVLEAMLGEAAA